MRHSRIHKDQERPIQVENALRIERELHEPRPTSLDTSSTIERLPLPQASSASATGTSKGPPNLMHRLTESDSYYFNTRNLDFKDFSSSPTPIRVERVHKAAEIDGLTYLDKWEKQYANRELQQLESGLSQPEPKRSELNSQIYEVCLALNKKRRDRQLHLSLTEAPESGRQERMALP